MANLLDLSRLTGNKSISDMTDSELIEHIKQLRASRRQTKPYDKKTTEKLIKPPTTKRENQTKLLDKETRKMLKLLTPEQMLELMEHLGGGEDVT